MKSYPLLQSQLGVFYDCLKFPKVMQYNIPCIVPLIDGIDIGRLEAALQTIFAARKELRIRFFIDEKGEPRQFVDDNKTLTIMHHEMTEEDFQKFCGFMAEYGNYAPIQKKAIFRRDIVLLMIRFMRITGIRLAEARTINRSNITFRTVTIDGKDGTQTSTEVAEVRIETEMGSTLTEMDVVNQCCRQSACKCKQKVRNQGVRPSAEEILLCRSVCQRCQSGSHKETDGT